MKSKRVTCTWEFYRDNCEGFKEPMRKELRKLDGYVSNIEAENAKLRELVRHMHTCLEHYEPGDTISCEQCPYDNETWGCDYERIMAELGIEVDE